MEILEVVAPQRRAEAGRLIDACRFATSGIPGLPPAGYKSLHG
jgi:hypothetical protein